MNGVAFSGGGRAAILVVAVLAFTAFVGARAVNGVILNPDFYFDALDDGAVFDQVFDAMLEDPAGLLEDPEALIDDLSSLFEDDSSFEVPSTEEIVTGTEEALTAVDESLADFNTVVDVFKAIEPIALVVFVASVGLLALSLRRDWARLLRWTGAAVGVSGAAALVLWFGLQGVLEDLVVDVALDDAGDVPDSFQSIMRSAVVAAVDNLSPSIVVPCVLALAFGGAMILGSFALRPAPPQPGR